MNCNNAVILDMDGVYRVRPYDDLDLDEHDRTIAIFVSKLDAQAYAATCNKPRSSFGLILRSRPHRTSELQYGGIMNKNERKQIQQVIKDLRSLLRSDMSPTLMARKGGNARARKLTAKRRREIASVAGRARWAKLQN